MHTLCACANQPAENVTVLGLQIHAAHWVTKFLLYIHQFGVGFPMTFFLMDACSRWVMLRVPWCNAACVVGQILMNCGTYSITPAA